MPAVITFIGMNFWYFSSPFFIILKMSMERCNSTTHIPLRTWFRLNQVNNQTATTVQNPFSNVKRLSFILAMKSWKVLVSSMKEQIWYLDLQQGAFLLSEDDSHLILALTKWSLNDFCFLPPIKGGLSSKPLHVFC